MEHPSLSAEHESRYHELLQFDAVQPDGHTVRLDVSAGGDMGDFAMRATRPGTAQPEYYYAYWTAERSIFVQLVRLWQSHRQELLHEDIARIRDLLASIESVAVATEVGEGKFGNIDIYSNDENGTKCYPMHGDGIEMLCIAQTANGAYIYTDDRGITVSYSQLWHLIAGMIGRSYNEEGDTFPRRTRYPTSRYLEAFRTLLDLSKE